MIYFVEGDGLEEQKEEKRGVDFRPCLAVLGSEEAPAEKEYLQLPDYFLSGLSSSQVCKFESHEGYDYIVLSVPDWTGLEGAKSLVRIYFRNNLLAFLCEDERGKSMLLRLTEEIGERGIRGLSLERILHRFFDRLTEGDSERMDEIEQELFDMEEALSAEPDKDYIARIIGLRRRLLVLKRYYEQLLDIAEALEENENELLSGGAVRLFRMLTGRTDRLLDGVLNLRDYASQVREAYQAQIDIRQNEIMKLFTVITAIFLPLTLIAGWYGMNLRMPEFQWPYAYPAVIIFSALIAIGSFLYFRKNKWF